MTDETKTYRGGCHCGAVRFTVTLALAEVMECNCSICSKTAWSLAFTPASGFELLQGSDALVDYQFAKRHIHHEFCGTCGIRSFGWGLDDKGERMFSVNVRCLDDVDVGALPVEHYDGASL